MGFFIVNLFVSVYDTRSGFSLNRKKLYQIIFSIAEIYLEIGQAFAHCCELPQD